MENIGDIKKLSNNCLGGKTKECINHMNLTNPNHDDAIFAHDRTCCVCRDHSKKYIQIHHIDGNHQNDDPINLAVLCLDCHTDTQLKGGFFRKLTPEIVLKYRNEWISIVKQKGRGKAFAEIPKPSQAYPSLVSTTSLYLKQLTDGKDLPINASFYFSDYYFDNPYFVTIVAKTANMTADNNERWESILKVYLFCALGEIAPAGLLVNTTPTPSQAMFGMSISGSGNTISIPNWEIKGERIQSPIQIFALSNVNHQEILVHIAPRTIARDLDYSSYVNNLERIAKKMIGKVLEL